MKKANPKKATNSLQKESITDAHKGNGRRTLQLIDGAGIFASRIAVGGPWIFMAGTAADSEGRFPDEALPRPPYRLSPSAQVRAQTRYILSRFDEGLRELGASFDSIVQVEQYITLKAHCDGYLEVSRGPGFLERKRPNSALMETGEFVPQGCVVAPTALAFLPGYNMQKEITSSGLLYAGIDAARGPSYAEEAPFSEIVMTGPYVFCTVWPSDFKTGVHPDARVEDWVWWGDEIRREAMWGWNALERKLEAAGSTLDDVVHCTVLLNEIEDLYELDLVWKQMFPVNPPARTVTPVRGLGCPRIEGAKHHREGAMKMEIQFRSIRPGYGVEKEIISANLPTLGHEPAAIRVGSLLWMSGQFAINDDGDILEKGAAGQLDHIFNERIAQICEAAGTTMDNLLRVRGYVPDVKESYAVYDALRRAVPADPPCVCVTGVPGPLQIEGANVMLDAVAYVPGSDV
jgi:enamine deaminase RidA (YjgF/YER057c/UK114 family)